MTTRHAKIGAALCAAHMLAASSALANNVQVTSVTLQNIDTAADTANVQFNLSWENSWRVTSGPSNWDATWVFVKYHTGDLNWKSANLDVVDASHSLPAAATLDMGVNGTRGMGAFIYRGAPGTGNNAWNGIKLKWNYGADGVSDTALITLDVHAVEMVYVPQGSFFAGDGVVRAGAADIASLIDGTVPATAAPFKFVNAGPTIVGPVAGAISATGLVAGAYKPVPTTFPNGFDAFYIMKYEGSQGQWAAFLNSTSNLGAVPYTFFETLVSPNPAPPAVGFPLVETWWGRQGFYSVDNGVLNVVPIRVTGGNPVAPLPAVPTRRLVTPRWPDRAFLSTDVAALAYLDWSGLRPMTEFEFEKAARGPVPSVAGEFAWGTSDIALLTYAMANPAPNPATSMALLNDGLPNEAPAVNYNEAGGNAWVRATQLKADSGLPVLGPCRVGMFAKPAYNGPTPPRIQSGAGYYGVMDLTGNLSELVARWPFHLVTNAAALFVADHGDGVLGTNGQQNVAGWPTTAVAFGVRGGSFEESAVPVSFRSLLGAAWPAAPAANSIRNPGIRGVRSAPVVAP